MGERQGDARTRAWLEPAGAETTAAAAAGAAQLPAVFLVWYVSATAQDDYGASIAWGMACLVVLAPLYLPVLGVLHAFVHVLPGAVLADRTLGRLRWPVRARHLVGAALVGAAWAAVAAALWDRPFVTTGLVLAGLGVLPVLAMAYARGRSLGTWGVWWRAGVVSVALFVLTFAGGVLATVTGLVEEYEPPRLSAAQVTGVWRGEGGAELRLLGGGRAEAAALPAVRENAGVCDGSGTWGFEEGDAAGERDRVVVRLASGSGAGSGCGDETSWAVGGTGHAPELFVFVGDPDSGDLRILRRTAG
ncbi:hypothetical protein [Streptomyces sp. NPDC002588]|uniref:hypothetical protein n=1 Tax=Streptomyces sp. NPDC002588 TaxID=3154419 RepID=UPI00332B9BBC